MPQKLIENSEGILQVYAMHNGHIQPQKIENILYSSTDSSVIQAVGEEYNNDSFVTNINLKTLNHGNAKIEIGAPGFNSQEIPITVYGNENHPVKLLIQSTPSIFSVNGPRTGYVTVELVNNNESPATAKKDIFVNLTTTDNRVVTLEDGQIIIKSGEYYGIGRFDVKQVGSAKIFASADSLQSSSTTITVSQANSPMIKMYVYPQKINNYQSSIAYAIAELTDASGNLITAKQDVVIPVRVTDPNANLTNSSPIIPNVESNVPITIPKGSYWGYTNIAVKAAANGTYDVFSSAPNGYVNAGQSTITANTAKFYDDKSARLDLIPVLATGKKEVIGVLHLEDKNGNPVIASRDLQIEIDSSDSNALSVDNVILNKGSGVALVLGKVGTNVPPSLSLHVVTYNDQTVSPTITLPTSDSFKLVATSLVPQILSHGDFPVAIYQADSSGVPVYFSDDSTIKIIPNDYFSIPQVTIHKGDPIILVNSSSLKAGTSNINMFSNIYQTSILLKTVDNLPSKVVLGYPDPVFLNMKNTLIAQIFDSNANPVFAQKDITLKVVSSNKDVLALPENITIPKGQYYTSIEITPKSVGASQISILADDMPLSTYKISVDNLSPTLNLVAPDSSLSDETFTARVVVQNHGDPVRGMAVRWDVNGALIQNSDSLTNKNGTANIVLLPNSGNSVVIDANVTGFGYVSSHVSKIIRINGTDSMQNNSNATMVGGMEPGGSQPNSKIFKIGGIDTLPIIVFGTIAMGGVLIKKKSLLFFKKSQSN